MLKSMLVGVSGSKSSGSATEFAIQLAKRHTARLVGVGAVDQELIAPLEAGTVSAGAVKSERNAIVLTEAERRVTEALGEFEKTCQAANVPHKTFKTHGTAAERLCEQAQRADVIVVGRKRLETADSTAPLTNTLDVVIKRGIRPVITVSDVRHEGDSVLVAYDGSLQAARTLAAFVGLKLFDDLPVRLISLERSLGDMAYDTSLAAEFLETHGYRVETSFLTVDEPPADGLRDMIDMMRPQLAVLGAYSQPWLREVLLGSVTKTLLRMTDVSLFLFH